MATRGSYVHNSMADISGAPQKCWFYAIFSKYWWFQTKLFTRFLELMQLYKQSPFFIFTICQNYTLPLNCKTQGPYFNKENHFMSILQSLINSLIQFTHSYRCLTNCFRESLNNLNFKISYHFYSLSNFVFVLSMSWNQPKCGLDVAFKGIVQ